MSNARVHTHALMRWHTLSSLVCHFQLTAVLIYSPRCAFFFSLVIKTRVLSRMMSGSASLPMSCFMGKKENMFTGKSWQQKQASGQDSKDYTEWNQLCPVVIKTEGWDSFFLQLGCFASKIYKIAVFSHLFIIPLWNYFLNPTIRVRRFKLLF